jgi:hypothetical protein
MKGASNVTLAQLIEAGVIEPGDQVLTVTVGGPGGTNTFIAGGQVWPADACTCHSASSKVLAFNTLTSADAACCIR